MSEEHNHTYVEGIQWRNILPFLNMFGSFRMALQPAKMGLALLLVILLYLGGQAMDFVWGPQVQPNEIAHYLNDSNNNFVKWLDNNNTNFQEIINSGQGGNSPINAPQDRAGIFETTKNLEISGFNQMVTSAAVFDLGLSNFLSGAPPRNSGVIGALKTMVITVPGWLYHAHPSFLAVYLFLAFLLLALIGGTIARLASVQAATGLQTHAPAALHFTCKRYLWFVFTPLVPLIIAFIIGLVMAAFGGLLFNFPIGDVIGAALFGFMLVGGFLIAVLLIATVAGVNLFYPALAIEGTDGFDVISRVFNYALGRPWRYLFYTGVMIVYGAITYLFVGLVIFLVLYITHDFVGWWDVNTLQDGITRFNAILPMPEFGQVLQPVNWGALKTDSSATISALIVQVWVKLLIALLPAYAVSYYFSSFTWVYLLLRKHADKTEYQQIYLEDSDAEAKVNTAPEKVDAKAN